MPELSDDGDARDRTGAPSAARRARRAAVAHASTKRRALLVISGPNMGGKTVALKMAGLFVVMAYCGMQIPRALGARSDASTRIFADIGDEQSIVANASTFSAHLERMREILDRAGDRTLAIVDEIGGGTEPSAGAALAVAMLERLLESRRARDRHDALDRTQALRARRTPGVANASVRFDPQTFAPTFELDVGTPGQSLAFPLGARAWHRFARSSSAPASCSSGASAITSRRWPNLRCAAASCERSARALAEAGARPHAKTSACGATRDELERERRAVRRSARRNGCSRACATSCANSQRRADGSARTRRRAGKVTRVAGGAACADDRGDAYATSASGRAMPTVANDGDVCAGRSRAHPIA